MKSYRFARRSFLAAVGGAFGLHQLLRSMEASAAGEGPPARFLLMNWPCGSIKYQYVPTGTGAGYTASTTRGQPGYIISPFATPELKPHTHIMWGFNMSGLNCPNGGAHEAGTPFSTTGASGPGTRKNGGEVDDGCAGGPSWDQILLKNAPGLKTDGRGYYNVICDSRVDSYETSTRCLSYGHTKQQIASAVGSGMISENTPLRPTLSPITAYNDLFKDFTPGGGPGMTDATALRLLKQRKSVLDHSLRELERLKSLAPANESSKIDAHAEIIRKLETQLTTQINNPGGGVECTVPMAPAMNLNGVNSDRNADYGSPTSSTDDAPNHAAVGAAHSSIIRAAFACDIIRVATFEWSPGTNHVSFKGADPNSPNTIYMHHPLSHRKLDTNFYQGPPPSGGEQYIWDAMAYVQWWYFNETAKFVKGFLDQKDPLDPAGGSLLDRTLITAVSEVGNPSHDRNNASALIIGGSKLGMQPGGFQTVTNSHHNRIWATAAQAFLGADPLSKLSAEGFYKTGVTPLSGLWQAPA